jgi:hypothetical protein
MLRSCFLCPLPALETNCDAKTCSLTRPSCQGNLVSFPDILATLGLSASSVEAFGRKNHRRSIERDIARPRRAISMSVHGPSRRQITSETLLPDL